MVAERRAAQTTFGSPRVCEWQHLNWTFYELLTIKERGAMGMSRVWRLGGKRGHFFSCLLGIMHWYLDRLLHPKNII